MRKKYLKIIVIFIGCILIMKTMRVEAFANQYSSISSIEDVIPLEAKLYVNENMNIFFNMHVNLIRCSLFQCQRI